MLSNILQKKMTVEETIMNPYTWYEEHGIALITGESATRVNRDEHVVETEQGRRIPYDVCIFATGSKAFVLPIQGMNYKV